MRNSSIYTIALLFSVFSTPFFSNAQEQPGLRMERYAGINSIALNPSFSGTFPLRWDLRLAGIDFHGHNTYGFARNTSVPHFLNNLDRVRLITDTSEFALTGEPLYIDFYPTPKPTFGAINMRVEGLGFSIKLNSQLSIGLTTAYRFYGSSYRIAQALQHDTYVNQPYSTPTIVSPFQASAMAWSETGLNVSFKTNSRQGGSYHMIGFTPKILVGHQAAFASSHQRIVLNKVSPDTLSFSNGNWEYGLTSDLQKKRFSSDDFLNWNGNGIGFDFGYTFVQPDPSSDDIEDYQMRLGISILDIGNVRFEGKAQDHVLDFSTLRFVDTDDFNALDQVPDFIKTISETFLQDSLASLRSNSLLIGLPMAFSLQADVKIRDGMYVGGIWVQKLPLANSAIHRVSSLTVVPRLEHRWWSVSVPLALYDYRFPRVGLAARLGYLTFGSEHLSSFLMKKDFYGTNFYVNLKFNPFTIRFKQGTLGKNGQSWKGVGCYRMDKKTKKRKRRRD